MIAHQVNDCLNRLKEHYLIFLQRYQFVLILYVTEEIQCDSEGDLSKKYLNCCRTF